MVNCRYHEPECSVNNALVALLVTTGLIITTVNISTGCSGICDDLEEYYFEDVNVLIIGRCRTIISDGTWNKMLYIGALQHIEIHIGNTLLERVHVLVYNESMPDLFMSYTGIKNTGIGIFGYDGIFFWGCWKRLSVRSIPPFLFVHRHAEDFGIVID